MEADKAWLQAVLPDGSIVIETPNLVSVIAGPPGAMQGCVTARRPLLRDVATEVFRLLGVTLKEGA